MLSGVFSQRVRPIVVQSRLLRPLRRFGLAILSAGFLAGCAGLVTTPPEINAQESAETRAELQRQALAFQLKRRGRLQALAWPLWRDNADLCGKRTRNALGAVFADGERLEQLSLGLNANAIRTLGHADEIQTVIVVPDSPAGRGGLARGDVIVALGGHAPGRTPIEDRSAFQKALSKQLKHSKAVTLTVSRDGLATETLPLEAERVCDFPVLVSNSKAINAYTDGARVVVNAGLERALEDDAVAFVLAHELAHAILRHPRKATRNAIVSGGALIGPLASTLGAGLDHARRALGQKGARKYGRLGAQLTTYPYSADFEREADYVALYLLARSGGNLEGLEEIYELFSRESPIGTWSGLSHPHTPERLLALQKTREEIRDKQARGEPLLPEGWRAHKTP